MSSHVQEQLHVVVGAGQVGSKLARVLVAQGARVRVVRRSPHRFDASSSLEWSHGDITDAHFVDQAFWGADVIYNCVNPPQYHRWDGVLQPMMRGVLNGAIRAQARLVTLDNLYMYGRPEHSPFDESTPLQPCSRKGALRAQMVTELWDAYTRGDVMVTTGRASDFFGPGSPSSVLCSPRFFERIQKGRTAEVLGDPDLPRSYSYTPDVAKALALLGTSEHSWGQAWHLPVLHDLTSRKVIEAFTRAIGKQAKLSVLPKWMLRTLGWLIPDMRAMVEMVYQWEIPYVVDDSAFREQFDMLPTPLEQAVRETWLSLGVQV